MIHMLRLSLSPRPRNSDGCCVPEHKSGIDLWITPFTPQNCVSSGSNDES
jgi:hypothetical protein